VRGGVGQTVPALSKLISSEWSSKQVGWNVSRAHRRFSCKLWLLLQNDIFSVLFYLERRSADDRSSDSRLFLGPPSYPTPSPLPRRCCTPLDRWSVINNSRWTGSHQGNPPLGNYMLIVTHIKCPPIRRSLYW